MTAGLGEHTLACVDEQDGDIGRGRTGDHVARVLLVARCVGDDELPTVGGEEPVGHIDGDALLALGLQAVEQEREVEVVALGADPLGVGLEGGEMILEHHVRLVEHPPDEGRLAVVDRTTRDESQESLALVLREVFVDVGGDEFAAVRHQK